MSTNGNGNGNGGGHTRPSDGRSAFARLVREIENELLRTEAARQIQQAQEHTRYFGVKSLNGPYEASMAKLTVEQFIEDMFPSVRRKIRAQAKQLALDEIRLDREIDGVLGNE